MESFYRTHKYLVEHVESPVKRDLMYQINKNSRLVGIKGSRGVGKTTFLLQYAKENYGLDRSCLYINLNIPSIRCGSLPDVSTTRAAGCCSSTRCSNIPGGPKN